MAAKDEATALKQKVTDLSASIATRAGAAEPTLAALAPKIGEADGRYTAEAYKLAVVAYQPILADLEALSARGFCPVSQTLAFETVPAGSYSLENVRLMTSSMKELGGMLGVANGAVKIDKSFCMQTKAVTRAEMAEYYTANSDPAAAQAYADNPQQLSRRRAACRGAELYGLAVETAERPGPPAVGDGMDGKCNKDHHGKAARQWRYHPAMERHPLRT